MNLFRVIDTETGETVIEEGAIDVVSRYFGVIRVSCMQLARSGELYQKRYAVLLLDDSSDVKPRPLMPPEVVRYSHLTADDKWTYGMIKEWLNVQRMFGIELVNGVPVKDARGNVIHGTQES